MTEAEHRYREWIESCLAKIDPEILNYDQSEFWMLKRSYEYIEYYAYRKKYYNTLIALPLSRGIHDGSHRKKSKMMKEGEAFARPYVSHCLSVCQMLVDLHLPITPEEEDYCLASALCHDMIEDIPFENGGTELMTQFGLNEQVYQIVKTLSKRSDFTPEEHQAYFDHIAENPLALLIKLADRGHNVEDLYNMSVWKVHEYVDETKVYFFPMYRYGTAHYPELRPALQMLQEKIETLTSVSEILIGRYEKMEENLLTQIRQERKENEVLRVWIRDYENRTQEERPS